MTKIGIVELAVAVLSGWLMVLVADRDRARRFGIEHPRRIRQAHLELLMMGTILVAVGAALGHVWTVTLVLIVAGSWVAPLAFVPVAFRAELGDHVVARIVDRLAFSALSVGYVLLAIEALGR